MAFTTTIDSTSNTKIPEFGFTNNKVLLSRFKPPKFNIALAIHAYDNAVAFKSCDLAANKIATP